MSLKRMARSACYIISGMIFGVAVSSAANAEVGITLVVKGTVDTNMVAQVCQHLERTFLAPVHLVGADASSSAKEDMASIIGLKKGSDIFVVALGDSSTKWPRTTVSVEQRASLVNVDALKPDPNAHLIGPWTPEVRWLRRVQKETARCVGLMLGVPECPFPRCCLYRAGDDMELDKKGYNPCPPCDAKCQEALQKLGATVLMPGSN